MTSTCTVTHGSRDKSYVPPAPGWMKTGAESDDWTVISKVSVSLPPPPLTVTVQGQVPCWVGSGVQRSRPPVVPDE